GKTPPRIVELAFQKLVRPFGQHLPIAQVLLDEQRGQPVRHAHRRLWIAGHVAHAERIALDRFDVDVRAHSLDDVLHHYRLAGLAIEIELENDPLEARTAENLLADGLQTILDTARDGRPNVALRN